MLVRLMPIETSSYTKKICKECVFFNSQTGQCHRFYQTSLIDGRSKNANGELMHPRAEHVRYSNDYCGVGGKYFKKETIIDK